MAFALQNANDSLGAVTGPRRGVRTTGSTGGR